ELLHEPATSRNLQCWNVTRAAERAHPEPILGNAPFSSCRIQGRASFRGPPDVRAARPSYLPSDEERRSVTGRWATLLAKLLPMIQATASVIAAKAARGPQPTTNLSPVAS